MRNAKIEDVKYLKTNIMYLVEHKWFGPFRGHIKQPMLDLNDGWTDPWLVETAEGSLLVVERSWLSAVPRKVGTPAKAKRRPLPGKKPWLGQKQYVPYDAKLIAPGVKVLCRDGKTRTIIGFNEYNDIVTLTNGGSVWLFNGQGNKQPNINNTQDIMKIIIDKSAQEDASTKQYSKGVWHFWQGLSDKPPVNGDVKVKYWLRSRKQESFDIQPAGNLCWDWSSRTQRDSDIIAFRIVE